MSDILKPSSLSPKVGDRVICHCPGQKADGKYGLVVQANVPAPEGFMGCKIEVDGGGVIYLPPGSLEAARTCQSCGGVKDVREIAKRVDGKARMYYLTKFLWCVKCRRLNQGSYKIIG